MAPRVPIGLVAVGSALVLAAAFTAALEVIGTASAAPVIGTVPADVGAGNLLQPLAEDLAWVYRVRDPAPGGQRETVAVVGRERVGRETAWLLEQSVGQSWAHRYLLVNRGGDLVVVAVESVGEDGRRVRTAVEPGQLFQPGPGGASSWEFDLFHVPGSGLKAASEMRRDGSWSGLGAERPAWVVETSYTMPYEGDDETYEEAGLTTIAEGVGPVEIRWGPEVFGTRQRLVELRTAPPPLTGRFVSRSDASLFWDEDVAWEELDGFDPAWTLELASATGGTLTRPGAPAAAQVTVSTKGRAVRIEGLVAASPFSWTGRATGAGLLGEARHDHRTFVLDFVPEVRN